MLKLARTLALAGACLAAGTLGAAAQADGQGGTSGGSSTGGVGWTPTPADGAATHGSDKKTSTPPPDAAGSPPAGGADSGKGGYSAGKDANKPGGEQKSPQ